MSCDLYFISNFGKEIKANQNLLIRDLKDVNLGQHVILHVILSRLLFNELIKSKVLASLQEKIC